MGIWDLCGARWEWWMTKLEIFPRLEARLSMNNMLDEEGILRIS
jgi:hypothetical protein